MHIPTSLHLLSSSASVGSLEVLSLRALLFLVVCKHTLKAGIAYVGG